MDIGQFWDKYIEQPKQLRKKVNAAVRLTYKNQDESNKKYWLTGVSVPLLFSLFYLFSWVSLSTFGEIAIVWLFLSVFHYQYAPRHCRTCKNKMVRQKINNTIFYFCDKDQIKIENAVGTDSGP